MSKVDVRYPFTLQQLYSERPCNIQNRISFTGIVLKVGKTQKDAFWAQND